MLLVEQGADKDKTFGDREESVLCVAAEYGHLDIIRYIVEHGADMEKADNYGWTPIITASWKGHLEVVHYLLEQGANRDKANNRGYTSLHWAARFGHLETAKLLMVYGADLNARTDRGELPIDLADEEEHEEVAQAIRDEPRRRMDHGHKRATEQDRHPNAVAPASAQQDDEVGEEEQSNKRPRLDTGEGAVEGDEDSEPSSDEEDD